MKQLFVIFLVVVFVLIIGNAYKQDRVAITNSTDSVMTDSLCLAKVALFTAKGFPGEDYKVTFIGKHPDCDSTYVITFCTDNTLENPQGLSVSYSPLNTQGNKEYTIIGKLTGCPAIAGKLYTKEEVMDVLRLMSIL